MRSLALSILLCCAALASAQSRAAEPVFLDYADSLRSAVVDSQMVRTFFGHVKFHQGTVVITCDKAVHNLVTNIAEMNGNVHILQDTLTITAPTAIYNANTKIAAASSGVKLTDHVVTLTANGGTYSTATHIAVFHGNVKIVNDTATITSDDLTYNRDSEVSIATGNVKIVDSSVVIDCGNLTNDRKTQQSWCTIGARVADRHDPSKLYGDSMFYDARRNYTRIPRAPLLVHVDSARADSVGGAEVWRFDTTFVVSRTMEAFRGAQETYLAHDSVRMIRGSMLARCGEADFLRYRDVIGLGKSPIVWYNDTQLTGDSITTYLFHNTMQRMVVENSAFAISRRDTVHPLRFDQLAGGKLTMTFAHDSVRAIRVEKNALSVYFGYDQKRARGVNRASGDTIEIQLAKGKPNRVYTLGGGEGQYFPEKMVRKNELDFRLTGFDNREAEKPRRVDFVIPR